MKSIKFHEDFTLHVFLEKDNGLYIVTLDDVDKYPDLCSRKQYFFSTKEQLAEFVSYLKDTLDAIE